MGTIIQSLLNNYGQQFWAVCVLAVVFVILRAKGARDQNQILSASFSASKDKDGFNY